ncbi:MAG: PKD domain-containing protein [Bacteroidetes bacterium]|nr:PKD domain-containing protein [Bacteroidota bacterium]
MKNLVVLFENMFYSKKWRAILFLLFCFQISPIKAQNNWIILDSLPSSPRSNAIGFSIGTNGYVGGGYDPDSLGTHQAFWEYNTVANVWTQKANLPYPIFSAFCFSINNKGYYGCGRDSIYDAKNDFFEYDPSLNTWVQKVDFGGGKFYEATGFSVGNFGYVVCGVDSNFDHTNSLWQYDPLNDSWSLKSAFPSSVRSGLAAFVIGNDAFVGLGVNHLDNENYKDFWKYNSLLDSWTQLANYPDSGSAYAVAFTAFGKGFIGGGYLFYLNWPIGNLNNMYEYNPSTNSWRFRAPILPIGPNYYAGVNWSINNRCFAVAGYIAPFSTTTLREYIPDTINISCAANYIIFADTIPHNYFVGNLATGIAPLSYSWDWGDGNTSVGPTPTHTYATTGLYTICQTVTDASGCVDTFCDSSYLYRLNSNSVIINITVVSGVTGNTELDAPINLFCYPNPLSSILNIVSSETMINFQLYDLNGNTIRVGDINDKSFEISIENLPVATYILEVQTHFGISKRKIIKM